jgi:hypothetical protein
MDLSIIEYSILLECSDFLSDSNNIPMYKHLPDNKDQDKVKIRLKSKIEPYYNHIDKGLNFKNFNNRSLKCYMDIGKPIPGYIPYYIFIPDGFQFIYTIDNRTIDLASIFLELSNKLDNSGDTFEELLKYYYNFKKLETGLKSNAEIIFYDIPYYYCIKADKPYKDIIKFYGNIQN